MSGLIAFAIVIGGVAWLLYQVFIKEMQ